LGGSKIDRETRERRYWYLAAGLSLIVGVVLGWRYPGVCSLYTGLHRGAGCNGVDDVIVGLVSIGLAVILAVIGTLRDPD